MPNLYRDYSLAKQSDAICCAVLEKHGGIWMDADTIITSKNFEKLINIDSECIMFDKHIGFIIAKQHAKVLQYWVDGVKKRLETRKRWIFNRISREFLRIFNKKFFSSLNKWNYLENGIINSFLNNTTPEEFCSLDKSEWFALPEFEKAAEEKWEFNSDIPFKNEKDIYLKFYFENDYSDYIIENTKGIILLHNSRVPEEYRLMNEKDFLNKNNTHANLFKKLLDIK